VVEAMYGGLNSGAQHAFSVYRGDLAWWPDETDYVRAARADIVDADHAPAPVREIAAAFERMANPSASTKRRARIDPVRPCSFVDARHPRDRAGNRRRRAAPGTKRLPVDGVLSVGTGGYELVDLGLWDQAVAAMRATLARSARVTRRAHGRIGVAGGGVRPDAPGAAGRRTHDLEILHLTEWLARRPDWLTFASSRSSRDLSRFVAPRPGPGVFRGARERCSARVPGLDLVG